MCTFSGTGLSDGTPGGGSYSLSAMSTTGFLGTGKIMSGSKPSVELMAEVLGSYPGPHESL